MLWKLSIDWYVLISLNPVGSNQPRQLFSNWFFFSFSNYNLQYSMYEKFSVDWGAKRTSQHLNCFLLIPLSHELHESLYAFTENRTTTPRKIALSGKRSWKALLKLYWPFVRLKREKERKLVQPRLYLQQRSKQPYRLYAVLEIACCSW